MGLVRLNVVSDYVLSVCCGIANQTRPSIGDAIRVHLRREVEGKGHVFWVWYDGDYIHGFLKGQPSGVIDWLFVDKKNWGRGIGRALIGVYERYGADNALACVTLYSAPGVRTVKFYQDLGYAVVGDGYKMQKDISQFVR